MVYKKVHLSKMAKQNKKTKGKRAAIKALKNAVNPNNGRVRGRGDYKMFGWFGPNVKSEHNSLSSALFSKAKNLIKDNAGKIGSAAGNYIAPGIGGALGGALGNYISGSGSYKINNSIGSSTNTALGVSPLGIPMFAKRKVAKDVADSPRWRECIGVVNASNGNCVTTTYTIQPSNTTTFPWGARRGPMYRKYNPHGIMVEYETTSSPIGITTAALGDVILFSQSRNDEPTPGTVVNCMTMAGAVAGNPSQSLLLGIECSSKDRQYNQFYCSDGTLQAADPSRFDFGTFTVCVQCPGTTATQIGRLWISCDIDFYEQIPISTWPSLQSSVPSTMAVVGGSPSAANPLCTSGLQVINYQSGVCTSISIPTSSTILFSQPGVFFCSINWATCTGIAGVPTLATIGSNIAANNILNNGGSYTLGYFLASGTSAQLIFTVIVNAAGTGANNLCTIGGLASMAGSGYLALNIWSIPPAGQNYIGLPKFQDDLDKLLQQFKRFANEKNLPLQNINHIIQKEKFYIEEEKSDSDEDVPSPSSVSSVRGQKLADVMRHLREVDPDAKRLKLYETLHPDFEEEVKVDIPPKMTESQLIDKTINKTIKRIKEEEAKSTDTPSRPLNVSPGWFGTSVGSVALARDYNNSK